MEMVEDTENYFITTDGDPNSDFIFLVFYSSHKEYPTEEFKSLRKIGQTIFIGEKGIHFGSSIDWESLSKVIKKLCSNKKIISIGICAGAYMSIIASSFINIHRCILFNPIYDLYPKDFQHQMIDYYVGQSEATVKTKYNNVSNLINTVTEYYLLFGSDWGDMMQSGMFPDNKNIYKVCFPYPYEHILPEQLKNRGILLDVFRHASIGNFEAIVNLANKPYN